MAMARTDAQSGLFAGPEARKTDFMRLAVEHQASMLRLALRLCDGNRAMADDAVQEAVIHAYRAFASGKFADVKNFRPWILTIVANEVFAEYRRNRHKTEVRDFERLANDRADVADPRTTHENDLSSEVVNALQRLSDDQRACVCLVDIEGYDYADAADVLGIPIGTVRSRLARARLKLAETLTTSWSKKTHD